MSSIKPISKLNKRTEFQRYVTHMIQLRGYYLFVLLVKVSALLRIMGFYMRSLLFKKLHIGFYLVSFPVSCFADGGSRPIISYFVDNIVFKIVASGGYYSLTTIVILCVLAWKFKKFREVLLSILMAIFGVILLVFVYQALEDFDWLPGVY